MNERIKQLSKQAGDYVNETYTGPVRSKTPGKIWEDGHIGWHTQFNEKFAELIAYECIDLALGSSHREDDMGAIVANKIKHHFGVESLLISKE